MKKELPEIYKKSVVHSNNRKVYYASNTDNDIRSIKEEESFTDSSLTSTEEKIRKLFKSSRYIFNIKVLVEANGKTYDTKIAGKVGSNIVTVDGEVIPISSITNLTIKDRL